MTLLVQHSAATDSWGTPTHIVEMARHVLGSIDVDPCSSVVFNRTVKARDFYTRQDDALDPDWYWKPGKTHAFVNPPGGLVHEFWEWSTARWQSGWSVFWVGFSLEQLMYLQKRGLHFDGFAKCIPPRRLSYQRSQTRPLKKHGQPTHGSYLLLMPNTAAQLDRFHEAAAELGAVSW